MAARLATPASVARFVRINPLDGVGLARDLAVAARADGVGRPKARGSASVAALGQVRRSF